MSPILVATVAVVGLVVHAVLATTEAVLTDLSMSRATTLEDETDDGGATLSQLHARRSELLVPLIGLRVALGAAVVVVVATSGTTTQTRVAGAVGSAVAVAIVEALARLAGITRTATLARRVVPILRLVASVPFVGRIGGAIGNRLDGGTAVAEERVDVSEEELLAMAEVAAEADVIESSERALIESILEFGDTIVREVMVPRPDMVTVEGDWRIRDVMEVVILNGFSRLPVVGDGIDDIVGLAYAKDLMRAERDGGGDAPVGGVVRGATFVPEQKRVSELLPEMQAQQFHMAVVIDEYGGVAGLVTLEDLIEELVGEIVDEFDVEEPMAEPLPGGAYRVNARMPLDEVNDLVGADLPAGDWDTVGGLLFGTLGHVPVHGEHTDIGRFRLTAARVQGRRIGLVRIEPSPEPAPDATGDGPAEEAR